MEYLSVIISENSVRMDPVKIAGIAEWPMPKRKKEGAPVLFGIYELLSEVHQDVFKSRLTAYATHQECRMDVGRGTGEGLPGTEEVHG